MLSARPILAATDGIESDGRRRGAVHSYRIANTQISLARPLH